MNATSGHPINDGKKNEADTTPHPDGSTNPDSNAPDPTGDERVKGHRPLPGSIHLLGNYQLQRVCRTHGLSEDDAMRLIIFWGFATMGLAIAPSYLWPPEEYEDIPLDLDYCEAIHGPDRREKVMSCHE